jgi:hypothetical protein
LHVLSSVLSTLKTAIVKVPANTEEVPNLFVQAPIENDRLTIHISILVRLPLEVLIVELISWLADAETIRGLEGAVEPKALTRRRTRR